MYLLQERAPEPSEGATENPNDVTVLNPLTKLQSLQHRPRHQQQSDPWAGLELEVPDDGNDVKLSDVPTLKAFDSRNLRHVRLSIGTNWGLMDNAVYRPAPADVTISSVVF